MMLLRFRLYLQARSVRQYCVSFLNLYQNQSILTVNLLIFAFPLLYEYRQNSCDLHDQFCLRSRIAV